MVERGVARSTRSAVGSKISRRPSGLRKTRRESNSLAHRTTWLRSDLWFIGIGWCFGMGKRVEKVVEERRRNLGWWSGVLQDRLDQLWGVKLGSKRDPDATKS